MSLFALSLSQVEEAIRTRLVGRRLVCEVEWDDLLPQVRNDWSALRRSKGNARYVPRSYPAVNLLFMVDYGLKHYDHNEFWTDLKLKGSERQVIGESFEQTVEALNLETFPQFFTEERAKRFVTIILAHGGIPTSSAGPFLRKALLPALASGVTSADELIARWRADRPSVFTKPVERFLFHGGETALDLLDRLITVARAPRVELEANPTGFGVPAPLVQAFLEIPEAEVSRVARWPRPEVNLYPFEGSGPQLVLPPLERELAKGFSWEVDDGSGTLRPMQGFFRRDVEPIPLLPADFWRVTSRRGGEERLWVRECFGEEPIVCFDEAGRYLSDAAGIRADSVWVLAAQEVTLSAVEGGELRRLVGEPGAPLPSAWRGHDVRLYDLRGVHLLEVAGGAQTTRMRVHRPQGGVELISNPLRDARSVEGDPVVAELPRVSLPAGSEWHIVVDAPHGRFERRLAEKAAPRTFDLGEVVAPVLGHYVVTVRGRLGQDLPPVAFGLVPGLQLDTPDEPCLPGHGDVDVSATAGPQIGLAGRPPGEPVTVTVQAAEDNEELWAWEHKNKQGVLVTVPSLRWAFRRGDELPTFGQEPLVLEQGAGVGMPDALLVHTDRAHRRLRLRLDDDTGQQLQISDWKETDTSGRVVFDLTLFAETLRSLASRAFRLSIWLGERSSTVVQHQPAAAASQQNGLPHLGESVQCEVTQVRRSALEVRGDGWDGVISADRLRKSLADYRVGEAIRATVVAIDGPRHVRLEGRPFDPHRFRLGQQVTGWVVRRAGNALLVDVEGYDAFVGAERLPPDRPLDAWDKGSTVHGRVIEINPARRLLRLAVAAFDRDRFKPGQHVTGLVTAVTEGGLFVNVAGAPGSVPIADEASGVRARVGQQVSGWVQSVDRGRELVMLTMRPFNDAGYKLHQIVQVRVKAPLPGVVLVVLPDGSVGGIPRKFMLPQLNGSDREPRAGTEMAAAVIGLDAERRRITLSATAATSSYSFGKAEPESPFAALRGLGEKRASDE